MLECDFTKLHQMYAMQITATFKLINILQLIVTISDKLR